MTRQAGLTGIPALQMRYWTALNQRLLRSGFLDAPLAGRGRNWIDYPIDSRRARSGFYLTAAMNTNRNKAHIAAVLRILDPISKVYYERLEAQRAAVEAEMGEQLLWLRKDDTKQSHIGLQNFLNDPLDERTWPEQHAWLEGKLHALRRVFLPRIERLGGA
jgi:hypothetical protein